MTNVDQFESVFKAADKPVYHYAPVDIERILIITDLDSHEAHLYGDKIRRFIADNVTPSATWTELSGQDFGEVKALLSQIEKHKPDLICTYRNLHSSAWHWPHSLGEAVDVITQVVETPVLLMPHPGEIDSDDYGQNSDRVMAVTDHLAGDDDLVNYAVRFTDHGGTLYLSHIENAQIFDRYSSLIGKIPAIDTDSAIDQLRQQILKEPRDFIKSCSLVLRQQSLKIGIAEIVALGQRLQDYCKLVKDHEIDLVIMHTKKEDQMAMHGFSYALAVELRNIPLLLL